MRDRGKYVYILRGIYVFVGEFVYVCIHMFVDVYVCFHRFVDVYAYAFIHVFTCMHVCVERGEWSLGGIGGFMYVCVSVCAYIYIPIYTYICMYIYTVVDIYLQMFTCTFTYTCIITSTVSWEGSLQSWMKRRCGNRAHPGCGTCTRERWMKNRQILWRGSDRDVEVRLGSLALRSALALGEPDFIQRYTIWEERLASVQQCAYWCWRCVGRYLYAVSSVCVWNACVRVYHVLMHVWWWMVFACARAVRLVEWMCVVILVCFIVEMRGVCIHKCLHTRMHGYMHVRVCLTVFW